MADATFLDLSRSVLCLGCMITFPVMASTGDCSPPQEVLGAAPNKMASRFFPRNHLFQPLLADPKEPRFFLGYRFSDQAEGKRNIGVAGFGETFPLYRHSRDCGSDGWQLDIAGGGSVRFDMEDSSKSMIDADYLIGLPLSWRRGNWSLRSRIYHESSHLGESRVAQAAPESRLKRSYNSIDFISSYTDGGWRIYTGAEYVFHHHPDVEPWGVHFGTEYHGSRSMFGDSRWISGVDVKTWQEFDFDTDISIKTGLSFGGRNSRQHHLQLMLEWYDGHANAGVFFEEKIRYFAAGIYFGF